MQDLFIEFLPPWVETNLQPAFYDRESGTVLQQTARMYGKINELVKAVNGMEKVIKEYVDYIDNYFNNLDVQEEINNKLDDMAEGGELAEIITAYLELKALLAFDTPSDLKSATNLIEGSFAKTYGYKRKGDGVYDLYYIREADGDVNDDYNTIILTNDNTLVAIRIQQGGKRVIQLKNDDNIQDYLSLEGEKEIILPANTTITETDALILNSDTTIDLNGSTLYFNFNRSSIFDYDWDETLGFMGYGPDSTYTGYNGIKNVVIKNGSIVGGCSAFLHSKDILIEGVSFTTAGGRHSIQLAGCNGFTVKNCTFNGARDDQTAWASEIINIDFCEYGGQPYVSEYSTMWDGTKSINILVESNTFVQNVSAGMGYFSAVGTHGNSVSTDIVAENVIIRGNNFGNPREYAIALKNYVNVVIDGNAQEGDNNYRGSFIVKRGIVKKANIFNNVVKRVTAFLDSANPTYQGSLMNIADNYVQAEDGSGDSSAVFILHNIHDSMLSGNTVLYDYHPIHINTRAYFDSVDDNPNDHTINLTIKDNTFEKTTNTSTYFGCRISTCDGVKFINNNFTHDGTVQSNWQDLLYQNTPTNYVVAGNTTDYPLNFVGTTWVTDKFNNNNAIYAQTSAISSTNTSGTFTKNINNFSEMLIQVGETINSQTIELKPYLTNGAKFDGTRTFIKPVAKNDGTYGVATFTISNSGADWAYVGDIPIRRIWAKD